MLLNIGVANAACQKTATTVIGTPAHCTAADYNNYTDTSTGIMLTAANCTACEDGYILSPKSVASSGACVLTKVNECVCDTSALTCINRVVWTDEKNELGVKTGVQTSTIRYADSVTCSCQTKNNYRCAAGYYAAAIQTDATIKPTCNRCPNLGLVFGTNAAGSALITSCYIPADISIVDNSGEYVFTEACNYSALPDKIDF